MPQRSRTASLTNVGFGYPPETNLIVVEKPRKANLPWSEPTLCDWQRVSFFAAEEAASSQL